ncbi:MAG TPA: hypothetical protein VFU13_06575 [Steroidobacteraceae bacterium]|nr:hypothetical protein [Steroidobacteraceae bacterium]
MGRRSAAWLCVLLVHALVVYSLLHMSRPVARRETVDELLSEPITLILRAEDEPDSDEPAPAGTDPAPPRPAPAASDAAPPAGESAAISPPARVDWPLEGKKSAARVLAAEAEAERVARMFAGPNGTWASLTKRQRSKVSKFRWKPGVDGLEKDAAGNTIYHLGDGCVLVNFLFIGCAIGKPKVHDDMFENMRQYFDEQRLPQTDEGNGTEPGTQPLP